MGGMIGEQAEKIERVSKKLQGEIIQVISQVADQKTHWDEWRQIVGEELHNHHQRITHLEQATPKNSAPLQDFSSSSPPPLGEGIERLQKKMQDQEYLVANKLGEVYTFQQRAERRADGEHEQLKKLEKKMGELEALLQGGAGSPQRPDENLGRISRLEVTHSSTHQLAHSHEHILRELDYRIGAMEKKLGSWIPPEVFHAEFSNLVGRLDCLTREHEIMRDTHDDNMQWVANKFKKMRVIPSAVVAPPPPCPMPSRQLAPGMGDFPPGPLSAPPLVLGSPDSDLQKKLLQKGRPRSAARALPAPPRASSPVTAAEMNSMVKELGAQLGTQLGVQIE